MSERDNTAAAAAAQAQEGVPADGTAGGPAVDAAQTPPAGKEEPAGTPEQTAPDAQSAPQSPADDREPAAAAAGETEGAGAGSGKVVKGPGQANIDLVLRIPVKVEVVLGTARMTIAELMQLGPGAVVQLDRHVGEPIDVMVNGRLVARGEVVVDENDETRLGIRLTEIVEPGTFC